jgi:Emfourin
MIAEADDGSRHDGASMSDFTDVTIRRSGGFAGRTIETRLASADLSSEQADQLRVLLERALALGPSDADAHGEGRTGGADRFRYSLRFNSAEGEASVEYDEGSVMAERFSEVVDFVVAAAGRVRNDEGRSDGRPR